MLTSFRGLVAATLAAASILPLAPAFAQTVNPADEVPAEPTAAPITITGNVALVTDYRFRGVSLSGGDPAIQGGVTATHTSGFYVGTWASSIDDGGTDVYGDMELDLFGGWSGNVTEGVGLDVGLLYYAYPTNASGVDAEYFEPYATVSGTIGPVTAKAGVNYAWKQDSLGGDDNLYLHTELSAGIPTTPISLSAHSRLHRRRAGAAVPGRDRRRYRLRLVAGRERDRARQGDAGNCLHRGRRAFDRQLHRRCRRWLADGHLLGFPGPGGQRGPRSTGGLRARAPFWLARPALPPS